MTQGKITTSGEIEFQPTSWDGEPLYSPATVQEGLFSREAFEQMPGQMAMGDPHRLYDCGGLIPVDPDARSWQGSSDETR